jgi:predicted ester cyclase
MRCLVRHGDRLHTGRQSTHQRSVRHVDRADKAVVRQFITEVLEGGNFDAIDDVLAPNYVNAAMGGTDLAGFKAMLPAMGAVISGMRFNIVNLVAEGDAVVARYTSEITLATGKKIDGRGLTYYRFANGKIVEDDPIETPDLTQELAALMPTPAS